MLVKCWKNLNLGTNKLKLDFEILQKTYFRCNNIHWEIDQWNRRQFGTKWHATLPNSVAPVKPCVYKWIYVSQKSYCQMIHKWHVCWIFIRIFVKLWFSAIFIKFMTKNTSFCRLAQQELQYHMKQAYFGQCSCCLNIDKNNYPEETELGSNPSLTLARTLSLSPGERI